MTIGDHGAVVQQIRRLFNAGTVAGMSEWQLLERFATERDEAAFEAIVARFGPLILGVCRRVLRDESEVEDAFQATFLVLVRKARALGERDALGHWLYGVAYRVALRVRSQSARRRGREQTGHGRAVDRPARVEDPARFEVAAVLDEELRRLPAKYRVPIVLCYFEGLTHEEAARQLVWPVGTVKGRLARARDLLRDRLTRRGLSLPAGALAASLAHEATAAAVPAALSVTTARAAARIAAGQATAGFVSTSVAALTRGVLTSMFLTQWKTAGVGLLVLGVGAGVLAYQGKPSRDHNQPPAKGGAVTEEAKATPARPVNAADPADAKYQSVLDHLDEEINMQFPNETPLEDVLKYIKAATTGPNDTGIPIYVDPAGLDEVGKKVTSPIHIDAEGVPLKTTLHQVLRQLGLDYRVQKDGLLAISSRNAILDQEIGDLKKELRRVNAQLKAVAGRAGPPSSPPPAGAKPREGQGRGAEDLRSQAILKKLDEPISMSFADETPLEDVLKYIKSATAGPNAAAIPIYVDPFGLNEAEKTMTSPVTLDLEGVPLKTTLALLLKQLGLCYKVKDGVLIITNEGAEGTDTPLSLLLEKSERGELTPEEGRNLIEMLKLRNEVHHLDREGMAKQ